MTLQDKYLTLAQPGVRALHPYQPGKPIDELKRELGLTNIVKLASNENPLGVSPAVIAALQAGLGDVCLYPDGNGFSLKEKLAAKHGVAMSQITLGNGSSDLLEFVVRVFAGPCDEVLFSEHSFAIYPLVTQAVGAKGVAAPAKNWGHDLAAMQAHISDKTRVIFIANPNNPTGTWLAADELKAFMQQVPDDIIVVLDEAYFEYAHFLAENLDYPDATRWIADYPNLLVTRTFSKAYGLAGLRVGYGVASPEVTELINRVRPPFNVNSLALIAAEAALNDEAHLQRGVEINAQGLTQLCDAFDGMGLAYIPSIGNFISVDVGRSGQNLYTALLHEGVIVRPVANYAMPNYLRVSVGLSEQNKIFLTALTKVLS